MIVTIANVAVFNGTELLEGRYDVTFDDATLLTIAPAGSVSINDATIDGEGKTLLPGLIDAHVHFSSLDQLKTLTEHGVTTALDMGTWPPEFVNELREAPGADIRSGGTPLAGAGGGHSHIPGFPVESLIEDAEHARRTVEQRVSEGADYIKLILEPEGSGGISLEIARAVISSAHGLDRIVIAHAVDSTSYQLGVDAGVDVMTHVPLDAALPAPLAESVHRVVPTLTMMRAIAENREIPSTNAIESVSALHRAGATIVAGTDSNDAPGVPASVPHGESIHDELALLVEAGLSPNEALRAATSGAAELFGLSDRGRIAAGMRADVLLVEGDPTTDIAATKAIKSVWTSK